MSINRYNYQEFFLLYTDNELKVAERKAVEDFIQQNPDLEEELRMLQHSILKPDVEVIFENKELLLQFDNTASIIHPGNFSSFAVDYADNELNDAEMARLEDFVRNNPNFQQEFHLIQSLKLSADRTIVFPYKTLLYRHGKSRKTVMLSWGRMAAAAIILLFAGLLWVNKHPVNYVAPYLAQSAKPVPSKSSDVTPNKSGKEKNDKLNSYTNTFTKPTVTTGENIAVLEKKSNHIHKKRMLQVKTSDKVITPFEKISKNRFQDNDKNLLVSAANKLESPKPAHVSSKFHTVRNNASETIAFIDASIERDNKKIVDQPVIKINAVNNNEYAAAITVANIEEGENVKNPLRGILRKASRFIDKNTTSRTSKKSGLLIGNIEIAFQ